MLVSSDDRASRIVWGASGIYLISSIHSKVVFSRLSEVRSCQMEHYDIKFCQGSTCSTRTPDSIVLHRVRLTGTKKSLKSTLCCRSGGVERYLTQVPICQSCLMASEDLRHTSVSFCHAVGRRPGKAGFRPEATGSRGRPENLAAGHCWFGPGGDSHFSERCGAVEGEQQVTMECRLRIAALPGSLNLPDVGNSNGRQKVSVVSWSLLNRGKPATSTG